jgi:DNA-directed RNA polymerase subunit L
MDTASVSVTAVTVRRDEIDTSIPSIEAALRSLLPGLPADAKANLPLAQTYVSIDIAGVPTAVGNAIRRVLAGEGRGKCLTYAPRSLDRTKSTDPFMMQEDSFVLLRVRMMPLCPQSPTTTGLDKLRFSLQAENHASTMQTIYSGDLILTAGDPSLVRGLFNPTHELAFLQPGKTLHIHDIFIEEGYSRDPAYSIAVRTALRPLDLEELPREMTHTEGGAAAEQSGYVLSSLVATPRRHRVSYIVPAAPTDPRVALSVVLEACTILLERLRYVKGVMESALARTTSAGIHGPTSQHGANAHYSVSSNSSSTEGTLSVKGETDTLGNMLCRAIYELMPDIGNVHYTAIPHENTMTLTVVHAVADASDVGEIIIRAVHHLCAVVTLIHLQISQKGPK